MGSHEFKASSDLGKIPGRVESLGRFMESATRHQASDAMVANKRGGPD
jgi:hypothetical protein